ncbi:MAG: NAD-dependent epimerase/dehydratase family protein [bacterium]
MRVLLTGARGYLGVPLAALLAERGYAVTGLDTGFFAEGRLFPERDAPPRAVVKDIRQVTAEDLDGFDAVVHLAELSNDPLGQLNPDLTYDLNYRGTVRLARLSKDAGIPRFVYSSSCSVYGAGADDIKTETSATNPQTPYAHCKVLVEQALAALADEGFSPTVLRNATAYGPSPSMRFDLVLNNLAGLAWTLGEIRMTSDGTPWRPLVHVSDLCQAVLSCLEAPREAIHNEVFNVGDGAQNYRVREIAEIVSAVFPGCRLTTGSLGGDARSYRVSFDKIHTRLPGFRCSRDARAGAEELLHLFERIALTRETFEFRAYTRVRQLEHLLASGQIDDRFFWRQKVALDAAPS